MRDEKKQFLYSLCEEIMPNIMPRKKSKDQKNFALMIRSGESIAPPQIAEIRTRTGLSPIFITSLFGGELDTSRLYARALGANLFLPRCASDAAEILSACNFSICESEESAILSVFAKLPAYVSASCPRCRNFTARVCNRDVTQAILIPYTKNRTSLISRLAPREFNFDAAIDEVRSLLF